MLLASNGSEISSKESTLSFSSIDSFPPTPFEAAAQLQDEPEQPADERAPPAASGEQPLQDEGDDESLFTPGIRKFIDDTERTFARWTRRILRATSVPPGVARFIETPVTLALIISAAFLAASMSLYSLKKTIALCFTLAYHICTHFAFFLFQLTGFTLIALVIFTVLSIGFIGMKICITLPLDTVRLLARRTFQPAPDHESPHHRARDAFATLNELGQNMAEAVADGFAGLDLPDQQDAQRARVVASESARRLQAWWRDMYAVYGSAWVRWADVAWSSVWRGCVFTWVLMMWMGSATGMCLSLGVWISRKLLSPMQRR